MKERSTRIQSLPRIAVRLACWPGSLGSSIGASSGSTGAIPLTVLARGNDGHPNWVHLPSRSNATDHSQSNFSSRPITILGLPIEMEISAFDFATLRPNPFRTPSALILQPTSNSRLPIKATQNWSSIPMWIQAGGWSGTNG
ncbi:MAG: hypothetical protein Ct9H90mP16_05510 [Candidatus Poseidoniales archaeon]|nr:MAG: hypothetical protein Ct9H90mP16_05510 [Candidatus Poseidoniales archaeon]